MVSFVAEPECGANSANVDKNRLYLAIDCGAGTFDVSFVERREGFIKVYD